jgi:hypothetical protein
MRKIIKGLKEKGIYRDKNGTWKLLPRRKGKVYGAGSETRVKKAIYKNRIRFVPSKKLKDKLCR